MDCSRSPASWIGLLLAITLYFQGSNSKVSNLPLCERVYTVAWKRHEPYLIVDDDQNVTGVLPSLFYTALRSCCRGEMRLNYSVEFYSQKDVIELVSNYTLDFLIPVQRDASQKSEKMTYPFVSIIESPGVAFYVNPQPSAGEAIVEAITSTWPLIVVMFLLVAISGAIFWILEMIGSCNDIEDRIPLWRGFSQGMWWAFVSMTTVGYGDICPQTRPGKVFSICWVMSGVACCALFTSYITTILTSACLAEDATLYGTKVGVLDGGEVHRMALKKNAFPVGFLTVEEIIEAMEKQDVDASLIDSYVAAEHQLSKFRLQEIIEHVTSNGVMFQNKGKDHEQCVRDYLLSNQDTTYQLISSNFKPLRGSNTQSRAEEKSQNLLDPYSPNFYIPVTIVFVGLIFLFIAGAIWDRYKSTRLAQAEEFMENANLLTLTKWRKNYMMELHEIVKCIHDDANELRTKCQEITDKLDKTSWGLVSKKTT